MSPRIGERSEGVGAVEAIDAAALQSLELDDAVLAVSDFLDVDSAVADVVSPEPELLLSLEVLAESLDDAAGVVDDFLPRLSVLKKPDPLNVTPTGVKTFLTGRTSPVSGWAISVRLSSWKPCWTSMVSPVSTNL